jgi:hypothetical protein
MKKFLVLLSTILLSLNFIDYSPTPNIEGKFPYEEFDPILAKLDDAEKLINYIDSLASEKKIVPKSVEYAVLCEDVVKKRFIWGYTFYSLKENWVAALAGKFIWLDLAGIVDPNFILKHKSALCSQQGIVIGEIFNRKKIIYRVCGFVYLDSKGREETGHFAVEAKVSDGWYYIDPTLEPNVENEIRNQDSWICNKKFFSSFFNDSETILKLSQNIILGRPNDVMAKNNKRFQKFTWYLSRILWLLPLVIAVGLFITESKKTSI